MRRIAIITARGGSKRIPRKNILPFMGKPMIAYAIECAQQSELFDEIMVSTDDVEICDIARQYGAKVPFMRSAQTANDFATTADVLHEVLGMYQAQGQSFDELCCIYPCVPLLKAQSLKDAYTSFQDYEALMPVCPFPSPIERGLNLRDGYLSAIDEKARAMRSQDLEPHYYDVGMFYWGRVELFLQSKSLLPVRTGAYIMSERECQDIDTMDDWHMAELKYKILNNCE